MEDLGLKIALIVLSVLCLFGGYFIGRLKDKKLKPSPEPDKKEYKYVPNGPNGLIREDYAKELEALKAKERNPVFSYFAPATKDRVDLLRKQHANEIGAFVRQMALRCDWDVRNVMLRDLIPSDLGLKSWMTYFDHRGPEGSWQKWVDVELPAGKHLCISAISVLSDNDVREIKFTHGHLSSVKTVRDFTVQSLSLIKENDREQSRSTGYFMPPVKAVQPYDWGHSCQFSIEYFSLATSGWMEIQLSGKVVELAEMDPRQW